jgi:outer membrane protein OmpA-like peptidoglycan-associated protein
MLFRLIRTNFHVPRQVVPTNAERIEDVFKRFQEADPGDAKAFVLWEPFVTRIKDNPNAHVLLDSSHPKFQGYIVDVLVVNKKYLQDHRREVQDLVDAYLATQAEFARDLSRLAGLIQEDAQRLVDRRLLTQRVSRAEAEHIVGGIAWKGAEENYAHFGLLGGEEAKKQQPLEKMIDNITKVLVDTGAMTRDPAEQQPAASLLDRELVAGHKAARSVEPVSFSAGSTEIKEQLYGEVLRGLAEKLKGEPRWVVEVRGNVSPKTNTPEDEALARQRAEEVAKWLREKGGVAESRVRVTVLGPPQGSGHANVTFLLLEGPK